MIDVHIHRASGLGMSESQKKRNTEREVFVASRYGRSEIHVLERKGLIKMVTIVLELPGGLELLQLLKEPKAVVTAFEEGHVSLQP